MRGKKYLRLFGANNEAIIKIKCMPSRVRATSMFILGESYDRGWLPASAGNSGERIENSGGRNEMDLRMIDLLLTYPRPEVNGQVYKTGSAPAGECSFSSIFQLLSARSYPNGQENARSARETLPKRTFSPNLIGIHTAKTRHS